LHTNAGSLKIIVFSDPLNLKVPAVKMKYIEILAQHPTGCEKCKEPE